MNQMHLSDVHRIFVCDFNTFFAQDSLFPHICNSGGKKREKTQFFYDYF